MMSFGLSDVALTIAIQVFFIVCVWRLARRLYPLIETIHGNDPLGPLAVAQEAATARLLDAFEMDPAEQDPSNVGAL